MSRVSQRKQIRAAIKAKLLNATACGARVYTNRFTRVWDNELPAILIYTVDEPVTTWAEAPREYERRLKLAFEVVASPTADAVVDDILDDIIQQIEDILALDCTLGERCRDIMITNTEYTSTVDGTKEIAAARATFDVLYYSIEVAIDANTALDAFETAETTYNAGVGGDAPAVAEDTIEPAQT